ncbi:MAG: CPBP family intramembrane metalloprotease [Bacteroidetes bacterium]|nr:CPBP family intramembrane metalloprotease [Bacteroidota bacterium]MDA0903399.1 CPBP family intramembrane metalloprotease [Bacteroidota bacterium]MDA1241569.1 CPBP family intramembrane metalloprotease [Bacteroidota bacterium]
MSFIRHAFQTMHPAMQMVMLACITLSMLAAAAVVGVLWVTGGNVEGMMAMASPEVLMDRANILVLNNANQLVGFLAGAWLFAALVGRSHLGGFFMKRPNGIMWLWAAVVAVCASPLLDLTYRINEWALVPGSSLHAWAGSLEAQAAVLTQRILTFSSPVEGVAVLFSVALLPALCEEWLFRGALQPVMVRATGQVHLGIWLTAAIFSAIHMQFFGFLPRMILGALFGYLVVYSGSIWPAILGHFINNAGVVVTAWVMGPEWLETGLEPQPLSTWAWFDWAWAIAGIGVLLSVMKHLGSTRRSNIHDYRVALDSSSSLGGSMRPS